MKTVYLVHDRQAYDKNYRQANIKNITAREKAYYEANKDKTLKVDCPCGGQYTYSHKSKHERTKKHLEFIS